MVIGRKGRILGPFRNRLNHCITQRRRHTAMLENWRKQVGWCANLVQLSIFKAFNSESLSTVSRPQHPVCHDDCSMSPTAHSADSPTLHQLQNVAHSTLPAAHCQHPYGRHIAIVSMAGTLPKYSQCHKSKQSWGFRSHMAIIRCSSTLVMQRR